MHRGYALPSPPSWAVMNAASHSASLPHPPPSLSPTRSLSPASQRKDDVLYRVEDGRAAARRDGAEGAVVNVTAEEEEDAVIPGHTSRPMVM